MNLTLFLLIHLILLAPVAIIVAYAILKLIQNLEAKPFSCQLSPRERKRTLVQAFQPTIIAFHNKSTS